MRLIDADALKKELCKEYSHFDKRIKNAPVFTLLRDAPTIDAVPVIRCKDCVHYKGHWYCETWNNSPGFPAVKEDGFCNMAERRTDAN